MCSTVVQWLRTVTSNSRVNVGNISLTAPGTETTATVRGDFRQHLKRRRQLKQSRFQAAVGNNQCVIGTSPSVDPQKAGNYRSYQYTPYRARRERRVKQADSLPLLFKMIPRTYERPRTYNHGVSRITAARQVHYTIARNCPKPASDRLRSIPETTQCTIALSSNSKHDNPDRRS